MCCVYAVRLCVCIKYLCTLSKVSMFMMTQWNERIISVPLRTPHTPQPYQNAPIYFHSYVHAHTHKTHAPGLYHTSTKYYSLIYSINCTTRRRGILFGVSPPPLPLRSAIDKTSRFAFLPYALSSSSLYLSSYLFCYPPKTFIYMCA